MSKSRRTCAAAVAQRAYVATLLGALLAALLLALSSAPALAQTLAQERGTGQADPFDALGTLAERAARRASGENAGVRAGDSAGDSATVQLDALAARGVRFVQLEREGRPHWCYDGEAFRRVLALRPDAAQQARAMLGLTRHDCIDPMLTPAARMALDAWRADLLDQPWPRGYNELPALQKSRLHLRRAGVWAGRAHQLARLGRAAQPAAERALAELAAVDQSGFDNEDQLEFVDTTLRVDAVRWAALPSGMPLAAATQGLRLVTRPGAEPGQTCVHLLSAENPARRNAPEGAGPHLLAQGCTFGTVWARSASVRPGADALAVAVQLLDGWTELWLFHAEGAPAQGAWRIDVLPPAPAASGLGTVEFAGWVPGAQPRLRVARASRIEGRLSRRLEVLSLDSLDAVKQASTPDLRDRSVRAGLEALRL